MHRREKIDATETDAQYQLGRIARIQGRLQEALNFLSVVVEQDDKHNQHDNAGLSGQVRKWQKLARQQLTARTQPA